MYSWDDTPDLNITPLVDVMLVLMAILMITAPTLNFEEQITLPQGSQSKKMEKSQSLTIRMDKKLMVYFGNDSYPLDEFADYFILKADKLDTSGDVFIHADESLRYRDVMLLLKIIKSLGFSRVSLITE